MKKREFSVYVSVNTCCVCFINRRNIKLKQMRSNIRLRQCLHIHISLGGGTLIQQIPIDLFNCFPLAWSVGIDKILFFKLQNRDNTFCVRTQVPSFLISHSQTECCKKVHARTHTHTHTNLTLSLKTRQIT